jgi:hypothetical protein
MTTPDVMSDTRTTAAGNTLSTRGGVLVVTAPSGRDLATVLLRRTVTPPAPAAASLRKAGKSPADYRTIGGLNLVIVDADWVDARHAAHLAAVTVERNRPATCERAEIEGMFTRAGRLVEYPGEYYSTLARAEDALAAWRDKYPADAAAEDARTRTDRADEMRHTARGALLYDADGSLDATEQQRRYDAMMGEADKIERGK